MKKETQELAIGLGLMAILGITFAAAASGKKSKPKNIDVLLAGQSYEIQGVTTMQESFEEIAKRLAGFAGLQDAEVMPVPKENGTRDVFMVIRPKTDLDVSAELNYFNGVPIWDIKVAPV